MDKAYIYCYSYLNFMVSKREEPATPSLFPDADIPLLHDNSIMYQENGILHYHVFEEPITMIKIGCSLKLNNIKVDNKNIDGCGNYFCWRENNVFYTFCDMRTLSFYTPKEIIASYPLLLERNPHPVIYYFPVLSRNKNMLLRKTVNLDPALIRNIFHKESFPMSIILF